MPESHMKNKFYGDREHLQMCHTIKGPNCSQKQHIPHYTTWGLLHKTFTGEKLRLF